LHFAVLNFSAAGVALLGQPAVISTSRSRSQQAVFSQQPTTATAGLSISPAVTVLVEDQYGNTVTTDNSSVTISGTSLRWHVDCGGGKWVATFSAINPTLAVGNHFDCKRWFVDECDFEFIYG